MAYEHEREYLLKLPSNPLSSLGDEDLDKAFFKASEDLSMYHRRHITPRVVTLQAIYNVESGMGEYESLRRQGVKSFSTKRGSISFEDGAGIGDNYGISPAVIQIIGPPPANFGRFV